MAKGLLEGWQQRFNAWSARRRRASADAYVAGVHAKMRKRGKPVTVGEYSEKFKVAPIGTWSSGTGCNDMPYPDMDDIWEFRADGTGTMYDGDDKSTATFEWKPQCERAIEFRWLSWEQQPPDEFEDEFEDDFEDEDDEVDDEDGEVPATTFPTPWTPWRYDFKDLNASEPRGLREIVMTRGQEEESAYSRRHYHLRLL